MSDNGQDIHTLRLGYYDRANLLPLFYPLKAGWVAPESPWKLEVVNDTPARLVEALQEGRVDVALVSPVGILQSRGKLASVGTWGLAVEGATATVRLIAPQRLDLIDGSNLAVTPSARGSSAEYLLKTLLKPYYDITLNLHYEGEAEYNPQGPRLIYGDEGAQQAAKLSGAEWVAEDMGVAWFVQSGLPMVWEILAANRDLEERKPGATEALQETLKRSQRSAQEQQATILAEATQRLSMKSDAIKDLFARQRYTLGPQEQKGLANFLDMASRANVVRNG